MSQRVAFLVALFSRPFAQFVGNSTRHGCDVKATVVVADGPSGS
jgi:hypothetical protein